MENKVAILVVTFNPDIYHLISNIDSYYTQCDKIFIVDNSDANDCISQVASLRLKYANLYLHQFNQNYGIALAQNFGINLIRQSEFDFIIEMDQDSSMCQGYVSSIINSYYQLTENSNNIAALGPIAIDSKSGLVYDGFKMNSGIIKVQHTLSSGLLINVNTFNIVGLKNESLFIDMVDWDWCWNANKKGLYTYIDTSIFIYHNMGDKHLNYFGFNVGVPAPIRHYYAFRNTLYSIKNGNASFKWKTKSFFLLSSKLFVYPFLLDNGYKRFKYMIRGIYDFFMSKLGKYNEL